MLHPAKILIVLCDVASGHRSSARAIERALHLRHPGRFTVRTVDLCGYADSVMFRRMEPIYVGVTGSRAIRAIFDGVNVLQAGVRPVHWLVGALNEWFARDDLARLLEEEAPDLVVSTHPLTSQLLQSLGPLQCPTATVVSDLLRFNPAWADRHADRIFYPTPAAAEQLVRCGVPERALRGPCFPLHPDLARHRERAAVLDELALCPQRPTVLLTGGGLGVKSMLAAAERLAADGSHQTIVLAGKSQRIVDEVRARCGEQDQVRVLGHVDNMPDFYAAADIVVAKPGPATILEAELFGKQVVLTRAIGYQEWANVAYATANPNVVHIGGRMSRLQGTIEALLAKKRSTFTPRHRADEALAIADGLAELVQARPGADGAPEGMEAAVAGATAELDQVMS